LKTRSASSSAGPVLVVDDLVAAPNGGAASGGGDRGLVVLAGEVQRVAERCKAALAIANSLIEALRADWLRVGEPPWQPTSNATSVSAPLSYGHPSIGTFRIGDELVLFGGSIDFSQARFSGGLVDFSGAGDWSVPPAFPQWDKPPSSVRLPA
jgi:hypothetical protein